MAAPVLVRPLVLPSRQEAVYERLRQLISTGEMKQLEESNSGLRLQDLASLLGVSTMPVREAVRRLEAEGLVTLGRSGLRLMRLSAHSVREIADMRVRLETLAMERAMDQMTPDAFSRLHSLSVPMDTVLDPEEWRRRNHDFHAAVYASGDYKRLLGSIENLWVLIEPYLRIYTSSIRYLARAQREHQALVQAIGDGDRTKALELVATHIRGSERALLEDPEYLRFISESVED